MRRSWAPTPSRSSPPAAHVARTDARPCPGESYSRPRAGDFDLRPLAIHVSYLVNLASADPVIRAKSIAAFRGELERAAAIGAEYLVLHPGSYKGRSVEEGIADFAAALRDAAAGFHSRGLTVLLENTAGAGSYLGSRFEELASIREQAGGLIDLPMGYCLDTCHLLAAGFRHLDARRPARHRRQRRKAARDGERARVSRQRFQDAARLARRSPRQHRRGPHSAGRLPPHFAASQAARKTVHSGNAHRQTG